MHKDNNAENMQKEHIFLPSETMDQLDQLSDVWRELLGDRAYEKQSRAFPGDTPIPTLEADPWSALVQSKGVEVVDLQHMHLQISDQEVEQLLQVMDPHIERGGLQKPKGVCESET
jgi:hypothetical protein